MSKTSIVYLKTKRSKSTCVVIVLGLLLVLRAAPVTAATVSITGGTNGPDCNSGGYFTPSSMTVASGDEITFSVPANDPYAGGMEILGFPQGNIFVSRGGSVTTQAITASVNYHGTWPNEPACLKGSGSVTVKAAVSPPSGSPPSSGSTEPTQSTSASAQSTPGAAADSSTSTSTPTATTKAPSSSNPNATTMPDSATKGRPVGNSHPDTPQAATTTKSPALKNVATIGGSGLAVIIIGVFIAWRLLGHRRAQSPSVVQTATPQLGPPAQTGDSTQTRDDDTPTYGN